VGDIFIVNTFNKRFTIQYNTKPLFRHDGIKKLHSLWGRV